MSIIIGEIYSAYCERQFQRLECKTVEIRADLFENLLRELSEVYPPFSKPYKIYGMEIKPVRATEDYRFMIMD